MGPNHVLKQVGAASFGSPKQAEAAATNPVLLRKCIESLNKNIDRIDRESQKYYKEMMIKMVTQDLRDQELKKTIEVLKELEYQVPSKLPQEFDNMMSEIREQNAIATQVAHEYHSGRFDFSKLQGMKLKKKK